MLDADLAELYCVETRALTQAVKRNRERFPDDFMFQLTPDEAVLLRSQTVISKPAAAGAGTLCCLHGARRRNARGAPSKPACVQVSIEIVRAFVRLRAILAGNVELARKLAALEKKYDAQFKAVFDAIRELMAPPTKPPRRICFSREGSAGGLGFGLGRPRVHATCWFHGGFWWRRRESPPNRNFAEQNSGEVR